MKKNKGLKKVKYFAAISASVMVATLVPSTLAPTLKPTTTLSSSQPYALPDHVETTLVPSAEANVFTIAMDSRYVNQVVWDDIVATNKVLNNLYSTVLFPDLFTYLPYNAEVEFHIDSMNFVDGSITIDRINVKNYYLNGSVEPTVRNFLTSGQTLVINGIPRPAPQININQTDSQITNDGKISDMRTHYHWERVGLNNQDPNSYRTDPTGTPLLTSEELDKLFVFLDTTPGSRINPQFVDRVNDSNNGTISFTLKLTDVVGINGEVVRGTTDYKIVMGGFKKTIKWDTNIVVGNSYNVPLTASIQTLDRNQLTTPESVNQIISYLNLSKDILLVNVPKSVTFASLTASWDDKNKAIVLSNITLSDGTSLPGISLGNLPLVALDVTPKENPTNTNYPSSLKEELSQVNITQQAALSILKTFFDGLEDINPEITIQMVPQVISASNSGGYLTIGFNLVLKSAPQNYRTINATFNNLGKGITRFKSNYYNDVSFANKLAQNVYDDWRVNNDNIVAYLNSYKTQIIENNIAGDIVSVSGCELNAINNSIVIKDVQINKAITEEGLGVAKNLGSLEIIGFKKPEIISRATFFVQTYDYLKDDTFPKTPTALASVFEGSDDDQKQNCIKKMVSVINPAPTYKFKDINVISANDATGRISIKTTVDNYYNIDGKVVSTDKIPYPLEYTYQLINEDKTTKLSSEVSLPQNPDLKYAYEYTEADLKSVPLSFIKPLPPSAPAPQIKPGSLIVNNRDCYVQATIVLTERYDANGNIETGNFEYPVKYINTKPILPTTVTAKNIPFAPGFSTDELIAALNDDAKLSDYVTVSNATPTTQITTHGSAMLVPGTVGIVQANVYMRNFIRNDEQFSFDELDSLSATPIYFSLTMPTPTIIKSDIVRSGIPVSGKLNKYLAQQVVDLVDTNEMQNNIKNFIIENHAALFDNYPNLGRAPLPEDVSDIEITLAPGISNAVTLTFNMSHTFNSDGVLSINKFTFNITNFISPSPTTTVKTGLNINDLGIPGVDKNTYTIDIFSSTGANNAQNNMQTLIANAINNNPTAYFNNFPIDHYRKDEKPAIRNYEFEYDVDSITIKGNILSKQPNPNEEPNYLKEQSSIRIEGFNTTPTSLKPEFVPGVGVDGLNVSANPILSKVTPSVFKDNVDAKKQLIEIIKGQVGSLFDNYSQFFITTNKHEASLVELKDANDIQRTITAKVNFKNAMLSTKAYGNLEVEIKISGLGGVREQTSIRTPFDVQDKGLNITFNNKKLSQYFAFDVIDNTSLQTQIIASINDHKNLSYFFNNPINPLNIPFSTNIIKDGSAIDWKIVDGKVNSISFNAKYYSWPLEQSSSIPVYLDGNFQFDNFSMASTEFKKGTRINVYNSGFDNYTAAEILTKRKDEFITWLNTNYTNWFDNTPIKFAIDDVTDIVFDPDYSGATVTLNTSNLAVNGQKVDSTPFTNIKITGFNSNLLNSKQINTHQFINLHEITKEQAFKVDYEMYYTAEELNNKLSQVKDYITKNLSLFFSPIFNDQEVEVAFTTDKSKVSITYNGYTDGNVARVSDYIDLTYQSPDEGVMLNGLLESAIYEQIKKPEFNIEDIASETKELESICSAEITKYIKEQIANLPIMIVNAVKNGFEGVPPTGGSWPPVIEFKPGAFTANVDEQEVILDTTKVIVNCPTPTPTGYESFQLSGDATAGENYIFSILNHEIKAQIKSQVPYEASFSYWYILLIVADTVLLVGVIGLVVTAYIRKHWIDEDGAKGV